MNTVEDKIRQIPGAGHMHEIARLVRIISKARESGHDAWADAAEDRACKMPLSVMVRVRDWVAPGAELKADQYEILLLTTGGPAVRIFGRLNEYGEPETAELQGQDWFTPWQRTHGQDADALLDFARLFYFG